MEIDKDLVSKILGFPVTVTGVIAGCIFIQVGELERVGEVNQVETYKAAVAAGVLEQNIFGDRINLDTFITKLQRWFLRRGFDIAAVADLVDGKLEYCARSYTFPDLLQSIGSEGTFNNPVEPVLELAEYHLEKSDLSKLLFEDYIL